MNGMAVYHLLLEQLNITAHRIPCLQSPTLQLEPIEVRHARPSCRDGVVKFNPMMDNFRTVSCCLAFTRNLPQASRLRSLRILPIPQTQPVLPPTLCTSSSCRSLTLADLLPESPPHVLP
jgi:hypothetical protein